MRDYLTLTTDITIQKQTIEKSVFIAYCKGVKTVTEAVNFVNEITKKHYDATHNCYAYFVDGASKCSDDGEPSSTAGLPIYESIKNAKLNNVCVVVTRYFGGIKLGTGGLVRAYGSSATMALQSAQKVQMSVCQKIEIQVNYSDYQIVKGYLSQNSEILSTSFETDVIILSIAKISNVQKICDHLIEKTSARALVFKKEELVYPLKEN